MRGMKVRYVGAAIALCVSLVVGTVGIAAAGGGSTNVKTKTTNELTANKASGKVKIKGNVPNKVKTKCTNNRKVKLFGPAFVDATAAGIETSKLGTDRTNKKGKWGFKPPSGKQYDVISAGVKAAYSVTIAKKQVTYRGDNYICKKKFADF